jgi:ABC-type multidrug transport system permease subunit
MRSRGTAQQIWILYLILIIPFSAIGVIVGIKYESLEYAIVISCIGVLMSVGVTLSLYITKVKVKWKKEW